MKRTRGKKGRISGRVIDQNSITQLEKLIGNESIKRDMLIAVSYTHMPMPTILRV